MSMSSQLSMRYLTRIMNVLLLHKTLTVTNLAMLSRVNHKRCNSLVKTLEGRRLVETTMVGNKRFVLLTPEGNDYAKKLTEIYKSISELEKDVRNVRTE
jgi:predicted transcriptional regulator